MSNEYGGIKLRGGRFSLAIDKDGGTTLVTPSGARLPLTEVDAEQLATDWNSYTFPSPIQSAPPHGCICPSGSNDTCRNQFCPRAPVPSMFR